MKNKITDKQLDDLMIFSGTYSNESPELEKQKWRDEYRKQEAITNQQIENAGSIEKWYERGRC